LEQTSLYFAGNIFFLLIAAKFCTMLRSVRFYNSSPKFRGVLSRKILGVKNVQTLMANISGTDKDIQNRTSI